MLEPVCAVSVVGARTASTRDVTGLLPGRRSNTAASPECPLGDLVGTVLQSVVPDSFKRRVSKKM